MGDSNVVMPLQPTSNITIRPGLLKNIPVDDIPTHLCLNHFHNTNLSSAGNIHSHRVLTSRHPPRDHLMYPLPFSHPMDPS